MIPPEPGPDPTPDPDPDPDPDPEPEPTTHTVQYTFASGNRIITTWLQTGTTYGQNQVSGSSTSENSGTFTFSCPEGEYYLYVGVGTKNPLNTLCTLKLGGASGTTLQKTNVTNGTVNAWRTSNPITINANTEIYVSCKDD